MKRKLFLFLLVGLAFSMAGLQPAQAIEFGLDYVYDGATPEGDRPWLIARFTDGTGPDEGVVRLTLDAGNLTESQKIGGFWFNIDPPDPFLPFLDFEFEYIESLSDPPDDPLKSIASGVDARKAGSADGFDIEILFNTSNGNGKNDGSKFGGGKTIVYDITAIFEDPSTTT